MPTPPPQEFSSRASASWRDGTDSLCWKQGGKEMVLSPDGGVSKVTLHAEGAEHPIRGFAGTLDRRGIPQSWGRGRAGVNGR